MLEGEVQYTRHVLVQILHEPVKMKASFSSAEEWQRTKNEEWMQQHDHWGLLKLGRRVQHRLNTTKIFAGTARIWLWLPTLQGSQVVCGGVKWHELEVSGVSWRLVVCTGVKWWAEESSGTRQRQMVGSRGYWLALEANSGLDSRGKWQATDVKVAARGNGEWGSQVAW